MNNFHKLISSDNFMTLVYVCLNKNYVYQNELVKIKDTSWKQAIQSLVKKEVLIPYKLTSDEYSYEVWKPKKGPGHMKEGKWFTLSEEAKEFFNQKQFYEILELQVSDEVKSYVESHNTKLRIHSKKNDIMYRYETDTFEASVEKAMQEIYTD